MGIVDDESCKVDLLSFIKSNYDGLILVSVSGVIVISSLDIYLPDKQLAINFNGLVSHNELSISNKLHLTQTVECEAKGIHLIQIYGDDWLNKQDIVKSRILNALGKSDRIFARKCKAQKVTFTDSKEFLNNSHLMGGCSDKIRLGLYNNGELVAIMTFGKLRRNLGQKNITDNDFELLRYSNKINTTVIGGANRLYKFFLQEYNPKTIISYADRSWTMNNGHTLYDILGFTNKGTSNPNYHYIVNDHRKNRFNYRKNVLIERGFDKEKTEHQIMLDQGIFRIYNSGQIKFHFTNPNFIQEENTLTELFQ